MVENSFICLLPGDVQKQSTHRPRTSLFPDTLLTQSHPESPTFLKAVRPSTSSISHQMGFTFPEPSSFNTSLTPSHPGHSEDVTAGKENIPPRARSDVLPGTGLSPGAAVSRGKARPGCFSVILLGEASFCWGVSPGNGWFAACAR